MLKVITEISSPYTISESNGVLRIINTDNGEVVLRVRTDLAKVTVQEPLTFSTHHTTRPMNIRRQPNLLQGAVGSVVTNTNLELSEPVTEEMLLALGLNYTLDHTFTWRIISTGNFAGKFIASQSGSSIYCEPGAYVPPSSTSSEPTKLTGKALSLYTDSSGTTLKGGEGMGANLREVAFWGTSAAPYMPPAYLDKYLRFLRDNGFKWVRFTAFHKDFTRDMNGINECIQRVKLIADKLREYDLLGCITFMDSLAHSGFTFMDYGGYHTQEHGHLHKNFYLHEAWQNPLLPSIEKLVTALRGHSGVGMWQIMNEPAIYPQPATPQDSAAIEKMFFTIAQRVHEIDSGTPISAGAISTHHFAPTGVDIRAYSSAFWKRQPNLHVCTYHAYQDLQNPSGLFADESYMLLDGEEAMKTKRAVGITEFGSNSNRVNVERLFLERHMRVSFALRWALDLEDVDKGIGDKTWGWMRWLFTDFEALLNLFKSFR